MSGACGKVASMERRLCTAHGAKARITAAQAFLRARKPSERLLVVGASMEAAAGLVRSVDAPAAFGWQRVTLGRLAALAAREALEERGLATLSPLGLEAVCAPV